MENDWPGDLSPAISSKMDRVCHFGWGMDMRPSRFTEEQVIGILREQELGAATADAV